MRILRLILASVIAVSIGGWLSAGTVQAAPLYVIVDDGFTDQAAVDVYNAANATGYVLGFDAFGSILGGVNGVEAGGTVQVLAGTYNEVDITINKVISVIGDPGTCGPGPDAPVLQGTGTGITERGFIITAGTDDVLIDGFVIQNYGGIPNQGGGSCGVWSYGTSADPVTSVTVQNCLFNHIRWAGVFFYNEGHSIFDSIQINCNTVNMDDGMAADANSYGIECTNCKNSVISNNIVTGGWTGILMTAQALRSTPTSVTVENNTISGNTVTGSVGWTGNVGIVSVRDRLTNSALIQNITISGNQIANSIDSGYGAFGIRAYSSKGGGTFTGTGGVFAGMLKVFNNSLTGNATKALDNLTGILWDASGNYWGSSDTTQVTAAVSSNVDYTPWMRGAGTVLNPGFSGDFSSLSADDNSPQFGAISIAQEAVDMVSGSTVYMMPGTYVEQIEINKPLTLIGSGQGITIIQAPVTMTKLFMTSAENKPVIYVHHTDGVTVQDLTVDGLGRGNTNYRMMGIGYYNAGGTVHNCEVKDIRDTPISGGQHGIGIYAYVDAAPAHALNVTDCWVHGFQKGGITLNGTGLTATASGCNVDGYGPAGFIAMNGIQIGFGAAGSVTNNQVSGCSYTGSGWSSAGLLLYNSTGPITASGNLVEECQIGINFIGVGGTISENTVTATPAGSGLTACWNIVADPGIGKARQPAPQPFEDGAVAPTSKPSRRSIAASAQTITTLVHHNVVDGGGIGTGIEADVYGTEVIDLTASENTATNFEAGIVLYREPAATLNAVIQNNTLVQNLYGLYNWTSNVSATGNTFANGTNASDDQPGNSYNNNCWSDFSGTLPYSIAGAGGNVDNNPNSGCGLSFSPSSIVYHCSGDFSFTMGIGDAVFDMEGAHLVIEYPAALVLSSVASASSNYTVFTSLVDNPVGTDVLTIDVGVLTGSLNGPAPLFTVALNGGTSICSGAQITMTSASLRDGNNNPIVASIATPVSLVADCSDPSVTVNSPAAGGFYNIAPVLNLSAADDCDLDAVYYQMDGCVPGSWLPIAAGLVGTSYSNSAWTLPGWSGLSEGSHCLRFKVTDGNGRGNSDSCSFAWCFTKDVTPPPAPTDLVATPGHNKVHLTWMNASSDFNHVVIMRSDWYSGGHGYPEYDDDNPEGPYPADTAGSDYIYAGTGAALIDVSDLSNATRDVYHYRAFTVDAAGNVSAPSNNARSTSYWLGDIKSPFDGSVYSQDLFVFAPSYGKSFGQPGYINEADFGPTANMSPKGIPTTDNVINFEDLVIFAINFDAVTPLMKVAPVFTSASQDQSLTAGPLSLSLITTGRLPAVGENLTVKVMMANNHDAAKALRFTLPYDSKSLAYVGTTMSSELRQSSMQVFFDAREADHVIDVSIALLGGETAIGGSGEIATVTFKLLAAGTAGLDFGEVDIRDGGNNRLDVSHQGTQLASNSQVPNAYQLGQNFPNPFNAGTQIVYQLRERGDVSLKIYNVAGQMVKQLVSGMQEPGTYTIRWDGRADNGTEISTGVYFYRMTAGDYTATKKMLIVK